MARNNRKKKENDADDKYRLKHLRIDAITRFFRDFRDHFDEDFVREFYDEDTEKRDKFLECFELTCGNISASCAAAGIGRKTYYNWLKSDAPINVRFRKDLEEIRPGERLFDLAELVVLKHLEAGSLAAAQIVLMKNRHAAARGYVEKMPDTISNEDKEFLAIKRKIEEQAEKFGVDYQTELREFLDEYKNHLKPQIVEKLASELIQ